MGSPAFQVQANVLPFDGGNFFWLTDAPSAVPEATPSDYLVLHLELIPHHRWEPLLNSVIEAGRDTNLIVFGEKDALDSIRPTALLAGAALIEAPPNLSHDSAGKYLVQQFEPLLRAAELPTIEENSVLAVPMDPAFVDPRLALSESEEQRLVRFLQGPESEEILDY